MPGHVQPNRRRSQRHAVAGHLWWRHVLDDGYAHGWIADSSRGGLAFVTGGGRAPVVGDTITVSAHHGSRLNRRAGTMSYTIRRIEPFDARLDLVACAVARNPAPLRPAG